MSTVVLASASGAPGVTTAALGLTLAWPGDCLLVDADRSASQALLAGYLQGSQATAGLESILQAHRERTPLAAALAEAERPLPAPEPETPARALLPGFTRLGAVDLFEQAWQPLLAELDRQERDVIVDAGRTGHRGLPEGLLRDADLVGLVCRTSLVGLAGLRHHVAGLLEASRVDAVGLILVGPGRPYASSEVSEQFGLPVLAEIAWDPGSADELNRGPDALGRRWPRSPLARSLAKASKGLHERTRRHELVAP